MYETPEDIDELQVLLDRSHERAGQHLRSIFTPDRRIPAAELIDLLPGVQVLSLATVTRDCAPRVAPVDGLFYRGRFWFGSSPTSVRFIHLRERPQVSAAHTRGESLAIVLHGMATLIDVSDPVNAAFRDYCRQVYGNAWDDWGAGAPYARIDATRMFTYRTEHTPDAE
ncbi:MAG: pyridoxamine 5'-phosphate oxidase family protein [Sphingomonas sp.]|nr:pyridoxamine 5'-phosphate oxidase family protein [Sphingomonas sp.]